MAEALRDIVFRELKGNSFAALEAPTDLAKVPNPQRQLFKNLLVEALAHEWDADENVWEAKDPQLDQIIGLAERFRSMLNSPPSALLGREKLFDRPLRTYAAMVEEFLLVAAHINAATELEKKRPRGGQPRKGPNQSRLEVFAEKVYRASLASGGKLTVNKNATGDTKLRKGSFAEVLALLRPYLPSRLIPKELPMGTLQRIKSQVDGGSRQVA
jgi:hypothetical protein